MNEETLRAALSEAGERYDLPARFERPSLIAQEGIARKSRQARRRTASRAAIAGVAVLACIGLSMVQPVRSTFAAILGRSVDISIQPGTLEAQLAHLSEETGPPEEIRNQASVTVAEALRSHPFLPAFYHEDWQLADEFASHEIFRSGGDWSVGPGVQFVQSYRNDHGDLMRVSQRVVGAPVVEVALPPETREVMLAGHPAFVSARAAGLGEDGIPAVVDDSRVYVFLPIAESASGDLLEITFHSRSISPESLMALAEHFIVR